MTAASTTNDDGLPFSRADIRHQARRWKELGQDKDALIEALTNMPPEQRRRGHLTNGVIVRLINEEWAESS